MIPEMDTKNQMVIQIHWRASKSRKYRLAMGKNKSMEPKPFGFRGVQRTSSFFLLKDFPKVQGVSKNLSSR